MLLGNLLGTLSKVRNIVEMKPSIGLAKTFVQVFPCDVTENLNELFGQPNIKHGEKYSDLKSPFRTVTFKQF